MMLTYFAGLGGAGVVIDGCIRDYGRVKELGLGLWLKGVTPNFHSQTDIFPTAVNVPIACGNTVVVPGDIIIADDDGAVVVPIALAPQLLAAASVHADWEDFSECGCRRVVISAVTTRSPRAPVRNTRPGVSPGSATPPREDP